MSLEIEATEWVISSSFRQLLRSLIVDPPAISRARSVIKVILQFCKENGLSESFNAIQNECQVSLNTIDSLEGFVSDINGGRWDVVLPQVAQLKLPRNKLEDLYEQVTWVQCVP